MLLHTCNTIHYPLHGSEGQGSWFFAAIQYQEGTSTLANYHLAVYKVMTDTANNIALNIAALHALGSKLSNITLTAYESIQITDAKQTAYQTTLDKILGDAEVNII
jgi:hypothetical protein